MFMRKLFDFYCDGKSVTYNNLTKSQRKNMIVESFKSIPIISFIVNQSKRIRHRISFF